MLIQVALISLGLILLFKALSSRGTHANSAWKKIALVFIFLAMIITVLFPTITTAVANVMGIGRGADLLLYAVSAAFLFYVLNQYIKAQDQTETMHRLARRVALIDAKERYGLR